MVRLCGRQTVVNGQGCRGAQNLFYGFEPLKQTEACLFKTGARQEVCVFFVFVRPLTDKSPGRRLRSRSGKLDAPAAADDKEAESAATLSGCL